MRGERINGTWYDIETPDLIHQQIGFEIGRQLADRKEALGIPVIVIPQPLETHIRCDDDTVLEPDLSLIFDRSKLHPEGVFGAPDMVIEILSPPTAWRDRYPKLAEYMEGGVREYWIVDPVTKTVMVYEKEALIVPMTYTFEDEIPVGVFDRSCAVNFSTVCENTVFPFPDQL